MPASVIDIVKIGIQVLYDLNLSVGLLVGFYLYILSVSFLP